jgi:hypothetical protein
MIKALLLDLGGTLIVDGAVLPGVPDALRSLQGLETAEGKPLVICLVSDYTMPEPRTADAIERAFEEYLAILDNAGLREFFEPVQDRVTLSTHAGVRKPDSRIFELALKRAKVSAGIRETLFITEDAGHVEACRNMGMTALEFGTDFQDWSNAPLRVAETIAPLTANNLTSTLKPLLAAKHQIQLDSAEPLSEGTLRGKGRSWVKLEAPELGSLNGVHVQLPVDLQARVMPSGQLADVRVTPRATDLAEAMQNVETLASNKQVTGGCAGAGDPAVLPTHSIETDSQGRQFLRRKRFTAW